MSAPRGRPRDPELATRVRNATLQVLLERGVEGTTVDAVAERAGAGKASLYRRWRTKDDLMLDALDALVNAEVPMPDTGSLREDAVRVLGDLVRFWRDERGGALLSLMLGAANTGHPLHEVHRRMWEREQQLASVPIERARARGELRPDMTNEGVIDAFLGPIAAHVITGRPVPPPSEIPALVELILTGIGARPATPAAPVAAATPSTG